MSGSELLGFELGLAIAFCCLKDELFSRLIGADLGEVSVVIASHFPVEDNGLGGLRSWDQNVLQ